MKVNVLILAIFMSQSTNAIRFVQDDDEEPQSSQSTVSLLKSLVNAAPALGNIQDRIQRFEDLKPRIESALDDAHAIMKTPKEAEPESSEKCDSSKKECKSESTEEVKPVVEVPKPQPAEPVGQLPFINPSQCCCDSSCPMKCASCGASVEELAKQALYNPMNYNAQGISKVLPILTEPVVNIQPVASASQPVTTATGPPVQVVKEVTVDDLVYRALQPETKASTVEQMGIKAFINHMGKDLTGPNFNQTDTEKQKTIEQLAKQAKHAIFGADQNDTKSIAADLLKDEDQEADEKSAEGALNKAERDAKNSNTTGNNSEDEVGVSMQEMKDKLNAEAETIEKDLKNDVNQSCEVTKEIEVKMEAIIPPPPKPTPPAPIVVPETVDNRTELEKAYDRAAEAIANKTIEEEEQKEEQREKIAEITNKTVRADEDINGNKLAKVAEKDDKKEKKDQKKKKTADKEEDKKVEVEIKKKIKDEENKNDKKKDQIKKEKEDQDKKDKAKTPDEGEMKKGSLVQKSNEMEQDEISIKI